MKTINLKGKEYAPVSARLEQFHSDHKKGTIETEQLFNEGYVIFKAIIALDDNRTFTGHAFGKIGKEKAFEKVETTAVGRALAFAGYLAGGEIASYDEVKAFEDDNAKAPEQTETPDVSKKDAIAQLKKATTKDELTDIWKSLSASQRSDTEVRAMSKELADNLE
ncbi:hypothetical protein ACMA5I_10260 [Paracoccaceae bacterium GXU_MW_L88]